MPHGTAIRVPGRDADDYIEDLEDSFTDFERDQIEVIEASIEANGTIPPRVCVPGGSVDGVQVSDVSRARFRFELTSIADSSYDPVLFLGISSVDGNELGAHDTLLQVQRVEGTNIRKSRCLNRVSREIIFGIEKALREQLPTALRDQVLDQLSLDPAILFSRREHVSCETDADCDFTSPNGAVYQTAGGEWRGGRHRCLTRDAQRAGAIDPRLLTYVASLPQGDFCHFTIEPERFNVRPAGFEVVLLDSFNGDPQGAIVEENFFGDALKNALCLPERAGAPLRADFAARRTDRSNRFSFVGAVTVEAYLLQGVGTSSSLLQALRNSATWSLTLLACGMMMGCPKSTVPTDGGPSDARGDGPATDTDSGVDSGPNPLYPGPDTCSPHGEMACGCLGTSRRCDTCADRCPELTGCSTLAPLCFGADGNGYTDECLWSSFGGRPSFLYCASGDPCLVNPETMGGACIPVETCLALTTADPPVTVGNGGCRWSTGEPADVAPPSVACPETEPPFRSCGGSCGSDYCPPLRPFLGQREQMSCVGVNAERGYGICVYAQDYCLERDPDRNRFNLGGCDVVADAPCACLVMDHTLEPDQELGYFVELEACRAYAVAHPGSTKCVDADWSPL